MAGIYIHIPFCRKKCYYCDFYKTVNISLKEKFLDALKNEIVQQKNYLGGKPVKTIYFGGGTPSVLTKNSVVSILGFIHRYFDVLPNPEITLEANPDDLSPDYLNEIREVGINRLSIGIQSFHNETLKKMNRRHTAEQAVKAVENAACSGFNDISVDLIYGVPGLTQKQWEEDVRQVFGLPVSHLSAYHLTYHKGTPFYTWLKKGTLKPLTETESIEQFKKLVQLTKQYGFEHYEISNFARDRKYSKHNSSYWLGETYLGLGPSAHSYDTNTRRWNVSSVESYINAIATGLPYSEQEMLTEDNKYNEYVLTRIRTVWGVSLPELITRFGAEKADYFKNNIKKYLVAGLVKNVNNNYLLTEKGIFISDSITASLMYI